MHDFTPVSALLGGLLIGLAASLLLLTHGVIAGVSGLYGGLFRVGSSGTRTRVAFVAALAATGLAVRVVAPTALASGWQPTLLVALAAGVLVGVGTNLSSGCTSGHGVCGLSRFSARSLFATLAFMASGAATVYVVRHVLGGVT